MQNRTKHDNERPESDFESEKEVTKSHAGLNAYYEPP